jgi:Lipopolysaccharide-assembly
MKSYLLSISLVTFLLLLLSACHVYNFTGGAIPSEVKTISIPVFYNESSSGPPNMSQLLTEKLKDYYQSNSKLTLVPNTGDWQLSGYINQYAVTPLAPLANETAAQSRLTIGVKVDFINTQDEKQNFSQVFPFYKDFNQNQSLSAVETELVDAILNQIVFDIFTKTTSNW